MKHLTYEKILKNIVLEVTTQGIKKINIYSILLILPRSGENLWDFLTRNVSHADLSDNPFNIESHKNTAGEIDNGGIISTINNLSLFSPECAEQVKILGYPNPNKEPTQVTNINSLFNHIPVMHPLKFSDYYKNGYTININIKADGINIETFALNFLKYKNTDLNVDVSNEEILIGFVLIVTKYNFTVGTYSQTNMVRFYLNSNYISVKNFNLDTKEILYIAECIKFDNTELASNLEGSEEPKEPVLRRQSSTQEELPEGLIERLSERLSGNLSGHLNLGEGITERSSASSASSSSASSASEDPDAHFNLGKIMLKAALPAAAIVAAGLLIGLVGGNKTKKNTRNTRRKNTKRTPTKRKNTRRNKQKNTKEKPTRRKNTRRHKK
jgi:hypothetical protein